MAEMMTSPYQSQYDASLKSIPPEVFTDGYNNSLRTPSGNVLVCEVAGTGIHIYDPTEVINLPDRKVEPTYHFTAYLDGDALSFYIRNRNPLADDGGKRHADIHPTALAARSLAYFQSKGWYVDGVEGTWLSNIQGLPIASDNWQLYRDNLSEIKNWWRQPTQEQKRRAAARTKTGLLAARIGFPKVVYVDEWNEGQEIRTRFHRAPSS